MADAPPSPIAQGEHRGQDYCGHVDFFGFHDGGGGLVFGGWASGPLAEAIRHGEVTVSFEGGSVGNSALVSFYRRPPLGERGVGLLLVAPCEQRPDGAFVSLTTGGGQVLRCSPNTKELSARDLLRLVAPLLKDAAPPFPDPVAQALGGAAARGEIDVLGHSETAGGWLASGWIEGAQAPEGPIVVDWTFKSGVRTATGLIVFHARADLDGRGVGFVTLLPDEAGELGPVLKLAISTSQSQAELRPATATRTLQGDDLIASMKGSSEQAQPEPARALLLARLSRRPYRGADTLADLADKVFLEVDHAIHCPPHGLALIGWTLGAPGVVRRIVLRSARDASVVDLSRCVRLPRPGVIETVGREHGLDETRCGFIAFASEAHTAGGANWLEVETARGEIGYKNDPGAEARTAWRRCAPCWPIATSSSPTWRPPSTMCWGRRSPGSMRPACANGQASTPCNMARHRRRHFVR